MGDDLLARLSEYFGFHSASRLHRLQADGELGELHVEAWGLREAIDTCWQLDLHCLALRADLDLDAMQGRPVTLLTRLADGAEVARSGIVLGVSASDTDGGWARFRLDVRPWLELLSLTTRSQVWTERSVMQIVESVFADYAQWAAWSWSPDVTPHLAASHHGGHRSYTVQYRESDLAFVQRLLEREAISFRFEADESAPLGHRLVLFSHSPSAQSCPEDPTSRSALGGTGIRFHREAQVEEQDSIQAFGGHRQMPSATVTTLAWDYASKRSLSASAATVFDFGGPHAPRLEHYEHGTAYAFGNLGGADRAARLAQQALEARHKRWSGRGTVRSFQAGTTFSLTQGALELIGAADPRSLALAARDRRFLLTEVVHAGVNNLPKDLSSRLGRALGQGHGAGLLAPWVDAEVRAQADQSGYANRFDAIRSYIPWRPLVENADGALLHPPPTAPGPLTATVVGPGGARQPRGADEIHTDRLGRILIQYDFQQLPQGRDTSIASTWVRVLQRYAGAGMGLQFIPRIGQEVLVDFIEQDMERPIVVAALYNGRGEGGVPRTPGGKAPTGWNKSDASVFALADDASPAGQANLAGGHSPAWHGASADHPGQRNAAAMSGIKTKEFGGEGFNQLVFDDTDEQLRVQLATTQHGTQLNLGHLIHQADNFRGSFRGLGWELRTDAYGAVRGGNGVLISSYGTEPGEPAGDNAPGIALALQQLTLAQVFSEAACTHEVVQLPGHIGSFERNKSSLDETLAPLKALHRALRGMVDEASPHKAGEDAASKNTTTDEDKLPHTTDPVVAVSAKAGLGIVAGQHVEIAAGELASLASGKDTDWAIGGALRVHTGQAIGMLAGAVKPGAEAVGKGLTMIANEGDIKVQAQADRMQVAAKGEVNIESAKSHIDWAAAKRIVICTAGGASITMEGGNITVACPGTITVKASAKRFVGPEVASYAMPPLPHVPWPPDKPLKLDLRLSDTAGPLGAGLQAIPWRIVVAAEAGMARRSKQRILSGRTNGIGSIQLSAAEEKQVLDAWNRHPGRLWLVGANKVKQVALTPENDTWTDRQKFEQAHEAAGYSNTLGSTGQVVTDRALHGISQQEQRTTAGAALLNKLKG